MARKSKEEKEEAELHEKTVNLKAGDLKSLLTKVINSRFQNTVAYEIGKEAPTDVKSWISTSCIPLDYIIANKKDGGIPSGKITEIVGQESSGKSLVCMHIAAEAQKKGGFVIYIDTESALNREFALRVGINIEEMFYAQPQTIEEVFETIEESIKKIRSVQPETPIVIIWDSVAGTPCQQEIDGTFNPQEQIGVAARAISKAMRKLTKLIAESDITVIFTNQLKSAIGKMGYGDPMTATYGGKAIPYHASLRIKMSKIGEIKIAEETVGIKSKAKVIKSKVAPPFRTCEFPTLFSYGIDNTGCVLETLKSYKEIDQKGAWASMTLDGEEQKFNKNSFKERYEKDEKFRNHCLSLLEKHMVIRYDDSEEEKLKNIDIDHDSLLEVEALEDELKDVKDAE